jgi:translation initiation factor 2 subunit 2
MESYESLLEEAYKKIKRVENQKDRFEIPKIDGYFEGKKTVLTNFYQISSYLRRNPEHFQKFILKELAASGQKEGDRLILNIRIPSQKINQKIEEYVKEYVLCKECKKPDTEILRDTHKRINYLKCLACGAKHPVK